MKALTKESTVKCSHGGAVSTQGSSRLTVNGKGVLLKSGIKDQSVDQSLQGCSLKTDSSKGIQQCSKVSTVDTGESSRLKCDGNKVVLDTLSGTTDGFTGPSVFGTLVATATQSRLTVS
jgi:hypothetical protein